MQAGQWAATIVQSLFDHKGAEVVKLLDPKITIKNKDKISFTNSQQDFMQAKKMLQQFGFTNDPEQHEHFTNWCIGFLIHSQLLSQKTTWDNQGVENEIFGAFTKSF